MDIKNISKIAQIVIAVLIIASILIQNRGEGLGSFFGGGGEVFRARRGLENILFISTVVLVVLFIAISLINVKLS